MNPRDDARSAAALLDLPSLSDMPWYDGWHTSGTDRVLHWEPAFCVLPGGSPRPAPADGPTDRGPW